QKWPCCSGTFPQITADYGISSYFATPRGLAVNLYHPSRVSWKQGGSNVTLTQSTSYPNNGDISLALACERSVKFPLALRVPAWAGPKTRVLVNGRTVPHVSIQPGTWLTLDREWRNGDRVELTLDIPLRLVPLDPAHPDLVALVAGPRTLFTILPAPDRITKQQLLAAERISSNAAEWRINTSAEPLRAVPYTAIKDEQYRLYHET
ncbi:MAG TPA: hypothetical protein VLI45_02165, partial [Acidobacteriaceae bacterium]|nr:hypothetical protein [Acidobacteriaceae bacterium]